jgi:small conductance mechanosensitive channel
MERAMDSISWARVVGIIAGGTLVWLVTRYSIGTIRHVLIKGDADLDSEKRALTLIRAFRYAAGVVLALVTLMLLLSELGISTAPLLGAAGVVGVAVGLASQGVAKDVLGGLSMLLDNQMRVGDLVDIAGKSGTVEALTLRSVKLRDYDGTVHFVRTGDVGTVTNHSLGPVYAALDIPIDGDADVEAAKRALASGAEMLRADPGCGPQVLGPAEIAGVDRWDGDAIVIRARLPVAPSAQATMRREWLARVKDGLDRAGVHSPTQRIRLLADPTQRND